MVAYHSLYRRYRSQRFDEVLGQEHITRALRNAVREGRVGHAYLFSGPRGTGKTSTARILAKVLNCAAPADGEPCGECENCRLVAEGRITDWLLEQDAASKSKVDDMRDLLERVPLGTSGNRKVIILDEVHMLSQGAENALLKTLEEPPEHVVFVLATTDPQKVRPTIRSRTQHFEFRLLAPDLLTDHVRGIIADAGLDLGDDAVEHVVRVGGGSARDTLSALDQVAALGEVVDESEPVSDLVDALCERDAGAVLVAVADALASGRDPRSLGEAVIASLRNAFLAVMGVGETHLAPADRERAAAVGQRLGAAGLTRALDVLGEALTELSRKPDPRVVVEVALVRLTRADTDRSLDAILERLDRLERGLATSGDAGPPAASVPAGSSAPPRSRRTAGTTRPAAASGSPGSPGAAGSAGSVSASGSEGSAPGAPSAAGGPPGSVSASGSEGSAPGAPSAAGGPRDSAWASGSEGSAPGGSSAAGGTASSAWASSSAGSPVGGHPGSASASGSPGSWSVRAAPEPPGGSVASARAALAGARAPGGDGPATGSGPAAATTADGGNPTLGAVARSRGAARQPTGERAANGDGPGTPPAATTAPPVAPDPDELRPAWEGQVLPQLAIAVRSKWRGGRWVEPADGMARFAVPNEWHQKVCDDTRREVEAALGACFGRPIRVAVVVDGAVGAPDDPAGAARSVPDSGAAPGEPGPVPADDEHIDPSELRDAGDVTTGVDLLMREFGGQLVEEER